MGILKKKQVLKLNQKNKMDHHRIEKLLLVFNLIMLLKTVSATYTATYLGIYDPKSLIHYVEVFRFAPVFFLTSLLLLSLPLFIKGKSSRNWCDYSAIALIVIGIIYIFCA